jgi:hypothetical protein
MTRVTRPGGRVVVSDADYETLVVTAPERALTRRILHHLLRLREKAEAAVGGADGAAWLASLEALDRAGRFFCALTVLTVVGRKPLGPGAETG